MFNVRTGAWHVTQHAKLGSFLLISALLSRKNKSGIWIQFLIQTIQVMDNEVACRNVRWGRYGQFQLFQTSTKGKKNTSFRWAQIFSNAYLLKAKTQKVLIMIKLKRQSLAVLLLLSANVNWFGSPDVLVGASSIDEAVENREVSCHWLVVMLSLFVFIAMNEKSGANNSQ